jgi:5-formaminoimidazole-4-carboxamide-1-(beta)-D-ribofuranosyl 5'-monophosphate synthetase
LQGAVTKDTDFYVFDVSPVFLVVHVLSRLPYMKYKYGFEVGPGRRVAMEIKRAVKEGRLGEVVT